MGPQAFNKVKRIVGFISGSSRFALIAFTPRSAYNYPKLRMSLAVRLLLALGLVAVSVTGLVGFFARDVSRTQVERDFEQRINAAMNGARGELVWEADTLSKLMSPLCKHDSFVDRLLLELEREGGRVDKLPPGRGIALRQYVPAQQKALRLDHLLLVNGEGLVVGASDLKDIGTRNRSLAERLRESTGSPHLVWRGTEASVQVHCKRSGPRGVTLGLVGSRRVEPILERVGRAYGVLLSLDRKSLPPAGPALLERKLRIKEIVGLEVNAAISRQPMFEAMAQIDSSIFLIGAIAVLVSVALAVFIARGLSQPLVELAQQTRQVVRGSPKPVRGRGGRELVQLANAFNQTIDELTAMRKRLARTERIAARREVARQVAHEIKNPLAPIRAAVETLRRLHARESDQFEDYFDEATKTVLEEVHRIKNIVSEFTKYARLPQPKFERVDIVEVARGVVALHDAPDTGDGPTVTLGAAAVPMALVDNDQIVRVLTNLIQNGIEAAQEAGTAPVIDVRIDNPGSEISIEVTDNGPGIDPAVRERLFEPYVSTKKHGTGLGLAIVQTIVHEHGGELSCGQAHGGGARFDVVLPVDGPPLLEKAPHSTGEQDDR
jgi:signal transduction histidine kinase